MKVRRIAAKTDSKKKRVAAYARVSTTSTEQEESYETQVNYFSNYIKNQAEWEFIGIYADKGSSGLSAEKRPEFMRMIADAKNGKMDLILVKSISRFARNAVEAQKFVKELKLNHVEVRFERENISSFDNTADMTFNMLAAVAQEESRVTSERIRWTYEKNAEKGIRKLGNGKVFGYDEINGKLVPNKDAWVIKEIFQKYVDNASTGEILQFLRENHIIGIRSGCEMTAAHLKRIFTNEIYAGDRRLQKNPHKHYLTKVVEEHEERYFKNMHEPIISREVWEKAQERNKNGIKIRKDSHPLYGKILCGCCGSLMQRKSVKSKGKCKKVWKCKGKIKGNGCKNPIITEENLLQLVPDDFEKIYIKNGEIQKIIK